MPKVNKNQCSLKEVYTHYTEQTTNPVDYKTHKAVLELFGDKVVVALIEGKDVKLPEGMSTLCVRKAKRLTYVDRPESKKQGMKVVVSNSKAGFYWASIKWRRHYTNFSSSGWSFNPSRTLTRGVSTVMKTVGGHTRYFIQATAGNPEQAKSLYKKKVLGL